MTVYFYYFSKLWNLGIVNFGKTNRAKFQRPSSNLYQHRTFFLQDLCFTDGRAHPSSVSSSAEPLIPLLPTEEADGLPQGEEVKAEGQKTLMESKAERLRPIRVIGQWERGGEARKRDWGGWHLDTEGAIDWAKVQYWVGSGHALLLNNLPDLGLGSLLVCFASLVDKCHVAEAH
jgi:hypothetical protein